MPFFINLLQPAKCPPDVDVVFFFIYIFPAQGKQFTQTNSGTDCKGYLLIAASLVNLYNGLKGKGGWL